MEKISHKTIETSPNYLRIILVTFLLLLLVIYTLSFSYMMYWIFVAEIKKNAGAFFAFIPVILFTLLTIFAFRKISRNINYVKVNEDGIKIIYPWKFKSVVLEWDQVKGFSRSDYVYGGRMNLKSKSVVIYLKSGKRHEIIELYNSGFQNFQNQLRKFDIIAFGYEGFVTKTHKLIFVKRVYKYDHLALKTSENLKK